MPFITTKRIKIRRKWIYHLEVQSRKQNQSKKWEITSHTFTNHIKKLLRIITIAFLNPEIPFIVQLITLQTQISFFVIFFPFTCFHFFAFLFFPRIQTDNNIQKNKKSRNKTHHKNPKTLKRKPVKAKNLQRKDKIRKEQSK